MSGSIIVLVIIVVWWLISVRKNKHKATIHTTNRSQTADDSSENDKQSETSVHDDKVENDDAWGTNQPYAVNDEFADTVATPDLKEQYKTMVNTEDKCSNEAAPEKNIVEELNLSDVDNARKAFIASELLKRKY